MIRTIIATGSAMTEARGTAEPYGGAYPPSGPFPRTPSRHLSLPHCGRAGKDGQDRLNSVDAVCTPF